MAVKMIMKSDNSVIIMMMMVMISFTNFSS